jgi:hypothetical protein
MKINEGKLDRTLRVLTGLTLIGLAITDTIGVWGYIGVIPLLTGAIGLCLFTRSLARIPVRRALAELDRRA